MCRIYELHTRKGFILLLLRLGLLVASSLCIFFGSKPNLSNGAIVEAGDRTVPGWLQVVPSNLRILVHQLPERAQIDVPVQEQLIVELYSK